MRVFFTYNVVAFILLGAIGMNEPANCAESNAHWLQKRITEAKSIEKGSDQESFNRIFQPTAGKQTDPPGRFWLKSCRPITVTAAFAYLGTPTHNRPHANIKGVVVLSISRLNLTDPDGLAQLTDKEGWLVKLLDDTKAVKPGISRTTLLKTFAQEAGLQSIPATRYVHKSCPYVKIDVTFDTAGKYSGAKRPIGSDDDLRILTVSEPYVDFQICD